MVLNEEKRAKLAGILTRRQGVFGVWAPLPLTPLPLSLLRAPLLLPLLLSWSLLPLPKHHPFHFLARER